ncbi:MAG: hypothetical protein WAO35_20845 [Terriglobia bacterium]
MRNKQVLPIPFLILILAGVVSLFSIAADRGAKAGMVSENPVEMQTVEQERMAAIYFRVLSWLSDFTPRAEDPEKAKPQPTPVSHVVKAPARPTRLCRIELCTLRSAQSVAASKGRAQF